MTISPLSGANLKIERARFHLDHIEEELQRQGEFGMQHVEAITSEDGLTTNYVARYTPTIDRMFPTVIGDLAHNLRSALDHLAWQLVIAHGGTPAQNTYFPIKSVRDGPATISGGVDGSALIYIENAQPYSNTQIGRSLELLRNINNVDKHRTLTITWAAVHEVAESYATAPNDPRLSGPKWQFTGDPIEDGAVIAIATHEKKYDNRGRSVNFGAFLMISVPAMENGLVTVGSLYGVAQDVESVVSDLAVFLN